MKKTILISIVLICSSFATISGKKQVAIESPDKQTSISIGINPNEGNQLFYTVKYHGQEIVKPSPIGFTLIGDTAFGKNLKITKAKIKELNESWERVWGKSKSVENHCFEACIELKETSTPFRKFKLTARAYNDGIAFRYGIPEQEKIDSFFIGKENTSFNFDKDYQIWASLQPKLNSAQEKEFKRMNLSNLKTKDIIVTPMLIKLDKGWAALLEANHYNWAGMYLTAGSESKTIVQPLLSPYPEQLSVAVKSKAPAQSPWRILMFGEKAGDLIESNIIHNLSEPNKLKDVSWIKPGRSAWDPWWSGGYAPSLGRLAAYDDESMKYFIDFASEMGWEYQLVDWLWYDGIDNSLKRPPVVDITKSNPKLNIPELVRYAKSKNVKLLLWLHWDDANKQMDKAFPIYEKWGIAGVKVDFMNRNDQYMVNFYERLLKKAAEHKLGVVFHGAHMPTGLERTYPNFLSCEGVMGNEFNKGSKKVSPEHCLNLPFTRMLGGMMDFTPGGFNHAPYGEFIPSKWEAPNPLVQGTRCFQLAMPVVYESALTIFCDSPDSYRGQEGLDFYKVVPTTWDETKVIDGYPGEFIIIARQNSGDWYLGAMNNDTERNINIPLNFLGEGTYNATIYSDASDSDTNPRNTDSTVVKVGMKDVLKARLAKRGGYVVHFNKN